MPNTPSIQFRTYIESHDGRGEKKQFSLGNLSINSLIYRANQCGINMTTNYAYQAKKRKEFIVGDKQTKELRDTGSIVGISFVMFGEFIYEPVFCFERVTK
jgi:hypothetical protein